MNTDLDSRIFTETNFVMNTDLDSGYLLRLTSL